MSKLISRLSAIAVALVFAAPASADVVQTSPVSSFNGNGTWGDFLIASVTLKKGTNEITGLTTTMGIRDQGFGGEDPNDNNVYMGLFYGTNLLWARSVAGGLHSHSIQNFDISSDLLSFNNLNKALDGVKWSEGKQLNMQMMASPVGYPAWRLYVDNASFTVTSDVPEPGSLALLGLGALGLAARRRATRA